MSDFNIVCVLSVTVSPVPQKLLPGVVILGAVLEVHEFEVIVSLPFNLRGSVAVSDISDQLSQRLATEAERLELEEEVCEHCYVLVIIFCIVSVKLSRGMVLCLRKKLDFDYERVQL